MKTISGRIRSIDLKNRIFTIRHKSRILYFYLLKGQYANFKVYLEVGNFVQIEYIDEKELKDNRYVYKVKQFVKLIRTTPNRRIIYFDTLIIKNGIKSVLDRTGYKMFIDLEFNMPPFGMRGKFPSEICSYGLIIEDNDGLVVYESSSFVKVNYELGITDRTIEFLNIKDPKSISYISQKEFYDELKEVIDTYNPIILVWGPNDFRMLENFYKQNNFKPITSRQQFINLMQLLKNYLNYRNDIGLFKALEFFDPTFEKVQSHNPLEDALVTSLVYHSFKKYIRN